MAGQSIAVYVRPLQLVVSLSDYVASTSILVATSAFVEYHERDLRESWWFQRRFLSASAVGFASVGKGHMFRQVLPHATM